ncbi:transposase [Amycolatopsis sp. NPDC051061]|uniref:IS110 family transposase n=1 Tax=Amycolatopsis sp. NPDC051061 TaxID=3155042 RepID=UPI003421092C
MPVIIGMDPHKRSATIEVINEFGDMVTVGKFNTDQLGYTEMLLTGRRFTERVWAVEGCNGVGRHIAHRLVHDGETVLDVPAKLSAQVRVFATGNGRKIDPVDAHSVALAALRAPNLVRVQADPELVVRAMLVDRRDSSAAPGRKPSTAFTGCCWSSFPAVRRSSCPRPRPAPSWRRSNRGTSWARPAAVWS